MNISNFCLRSLWMVPIKLAKANQDKIENIKPIQWPIFGRFRTCNYIIYCTVRENARSSKTNIYKQKSDELSIITSRYTCIKPKKVCFQFVSFSTRPSLVVAAF